MEGLWSTHTHFSEATNINPTRHSLHRHHTWGLCQHPPPPGRSSTPELLTRPAKRQPHRNPQASLARLEVQACPSLPSLLSPALASLPIITFCFLPHCGKNNFLLKCLNLYVILHTFFFFAHRWLNSDTKAE